MVYATRTNYILSQLLKIKWRHLANANSHNK